MKSSSFAERRCHEAGIERLELAGAEAPPSDGAPVHPEGRDHQAIEIPERSGHEAGIGLLELVGARATEATPSITPGAPVIAVDFAERRCHEAGLEHVELGLTGAASPEAALPFLDGIHQ
jgi:hypothetical protein